MVGSSEAGEAAEPRRVAGRHRAGTIPTNVAFGQLACQFYKAPAQDENVAPIAGLPTGNPTLPRLALPLEPLVQMERMFYNVGWATRRPPVFRFSGTAT